MFISTKSYEKKGDKYSNKNEENSKKSNRNNKINNDDEVIKGKIEELVPSMSVFGIHPEIIQTSNIAPDEYNYGNNPNDPRYSKNKNEHDVYEDSKDGSDNNNLTKRNSDNTSNTSYSSVKKTHVSRATNGNIINKLSNIAQNNKSSVRTLRFGITEHEISKQSLNNKHYMFMVKRALKGICCSDSELSNEDRILKTYCNNRIGEEIRKKNMDGISLLEASVEKWQYDENCNEISCEVVLKELNFKLKNSTPEKQIKDTLNFVTGFIEDFILKEILSKKRVQIEGNVVISIIKNKE